MKIDVLQGVVWRIFERRGYRGDARRCGLDLAAAAGRVAAAVNNLNSLYRPKTGDERVELADGLCDLMIHAFALANVAEIDLDRALATKVMKMDEEEE